MSHDPNDIPRLLAALDAGADISIGSRFLKDSRLDYRGFRSFLSRAANTSAKLLTRLPISEYTTSLRAAETVEEEGYSFFFICIVRFARQDLRIEEIPIHFHERLAGRSKISKWEILRSAYNLIRLALEQDSNTRP
jgi:dolichol-phosphate mannosyltransferase